MTENVFYNIQMYNLNKENSFNLVIDNKKKLKLIPIKGKNNIEKTYIEEIKKEIQNRLQLKEDSNLFNEYSIFLDFEFDLKEGFIILEDKFLKIKMKITIPEDKKKELIQYHKDKLKLIKTYLIEVKNSKETFSWEQDILISQTWKENFNVNLFVTSITYLLKEMIKENNLKQDLSEEKTLEILSSDRFKDKKNLTLEQIFNTVFC